MLCRERTYLFRIFCRQGNAACQYMRLRDLLKSNAKKDNIGNVADIVSVLAPRDATA